MSRKNGIDRVTLDDARELTPPVDPVEAMRRQLALTLFDAVKPDDVLTLANKLRDMAMAGDLKAMQMYLKLVLPKDQAPPREDSAGLRLMAEALQNLVDEIRISKAPPPESASEELKPLPGRSRVLIRDDPAPD